MCATRPKQKLSKWLARAVQGSFETTLLSTPKAKASENGEHEQTRIIPQNKDFRLLDSEVIEGRPSYMLEISPKTNSSFLVRGRIWVDAQVFAIMGLKAVPANTPSFWIRGVHIVHR